jgi:integrase
MRKSVGREAAQATGAGQEPHARLYWKRGRAYIDAREWSPWGGRQEALVAPGEKYATTDAVTAAILYGQRLTELREQRKTHPEGIAPRREAEDPLDRIATFAGWYLAEKENRHGRKKVTQVWLRVQERRLVHAARFFAQRGCERLTELGPAEIRAYMEELRTRPPEREARSVGGRRGKLSCTTQRRYLDTLGELLQAAVAEGRIDRNWVTERTDLPSVDPSPTKHLEVGEAALLMEGARVLFPPDQPGLPLYPLLGFYLLTGVIESERAGVRVSDVRMPGDLEFPRGAVIIRANPTVRAEDNGNRLKTDYRERVIPLHPQLAEILAEYLAGPSAPRGPLLFPAEGSDGTVPLGDWRKSLDRIAGFCGFAEGSVRTRRFRVTYCTHRAYTLDEHGQAMTPMKLQAEMGHGSLEMIDRRYFRHTRLRASRSHLEFRWSEWAAQYAHRLGADPERRSPWEPTPKLKAVLALLPPGGLTAKEWEHASGLPAGTFYYCRDRLVASGAVWKDGTRRFARFRRVEGEAGKLQGETTDQAA